MFLLKEEKIDIINLLVKNLEVIPSNRVKSAISIILDEGNKLISGSDDLVNKIESIFVKKGIIEKGDLVSVLKKYKSNNFVDRLAKAILDSGKVGFSNPRMFIRAGYVYWKTLEYVEIFDRRLTRYIVGNGNFSDDTKRSMLLVIYPNYHNFFITNMGENNIYHAIDRYYNHDLYSSVTELILPSRIQFTSFVNDVSDIFNSIINSEGQLEDLFHIISWNRRFREDIFKYVSEGNNNNFNQKIRRFFFETEQVNEDYVNIVAKNILLKINLCQKKML